MTENPRDSWYYEYHDIIEPTINFFYEPRTVTLLVGFIVFVAYSAFYTLVDTDLVLNVKFGLGAILIVILITGIIEFRDGPFIRPHPVFWRMILAINVAYVDRYLMMMSFILFQKKDNVREWLGLLDHNLGSPLPERSYAEDCSLNYDAITSQLDIFVLAHTLGWFAKAIILRDVWFCWVLSIMFEIMEYSLQHQLPNFAECWWDHWVLDVLLTNWLGLYLGMKTCEYFEVKKYSWRGIRDIPHYSGKLSRTMQQFTPHSWTSFNWATTKSVKNFISVIILLYLALQCEINIFYLKYLLWIPVDHPYLKIRLVLFFFFSLPAVRELYQYVSDSRCKQLGAHAWMTAATIICELFVCVKFGRNEFQKAAPPAVIYGWTIGIVMGIVYIIYKFVLPEISKRRSKRRIGGKPTPKLKRSRSKILENKLD